ncbi:MAG TPA: hypothetical protein VIJ31_12115 [Acidothermaceae bacterium]
MTADLVPVDNMTALEALEPQARELAITNMLTEARGWLAHAVEATEPRAIADFKAQMAAVAEISRQLNLSKEIQLDATEMVRRAERGVGVAIREGQSAGEIRKHGQRKGVFTESEDSPRARPEDFAGKTELYGNGAGIYDLIDDVSDERFEEALTEAKNEGNMSRANVVRHVKKQPGPTSRDQRADTIRDLAQQGYSSRQMPGKVGVTEETVRAIARDFDIEIPADKVIGKTRRHDSTRIVGAIVSELSGLRLSLDLVDYEDLDPMQAQEWATSLDESFKTLTGFRKQINRIAEKVAHDQPQE